MREIHAERLGDGGGKHGISGPICELGEQDALSFFEHAGGH